MATFNLPEIFPGIPVTLHPDLTSTQLLSHKPFTNWLTTLKSSLLLQSEEWHPFHKQPYTLRSIQIQSVDYFNPEGTRIECVKFKADIRNANPDDLGLPGGVFLRGGSVAMLMILRPNDSSDERWVIMTEQARVSAGSLCFTEIPAGMLDESGSFVGGAVNEIKEETGLDIPADELIDLTALVLKDASGMEKLQAGMYPSPGGSDEFIPIFLWEKELDRSEIDDLRGKITGVRAEGKNITIKLVRYEELWRYGARDAKTLAAWALYAGLKRETEEGRNAAALRDVYSR